ncbi:MAG TPA: hypothetical protein GXZ93_06500 [Actinobacteria bacterium]|jgi:predicted transcriptional regulator|nr:hypothetical protein [Actinomycetota bacterium]
MACVNSDGTITSTAKELLQLIKEPYSAEEIAEKLKRPLFKVRVSLRELNEAGFADKADNDKYIISEAGMTKI